MTQSSNPRQEHDMSDLDRLGPDEFKSHVEHCLKIRSNEEPAAHKDAWDELLSPALAERTRHALTSIRLDLQGQMGQRRPDQFGPDGDAHRSWRRRALGFMRNVDSKLSQAKFAERQANRDVAAATRDLRSAVRRLAVAIAKHRSRVGSGGTEADRELWSVLGSIGVPFNGNGLVALSELMEDGDWGFAALDERKAS